VNLERTEIEQVLREELQGRPEIIFAYLFGSIADGIPFRDVDVAVYVRDKPGSKEEFEYALNLGEALEQKTGYPVDVVLLHSAPDHLIYSISKGKLLLSKDEDLRADFITAAWSRYFDIREKRRTAILDMLG